MRGYILSSYVGNVGNIIIDDDAERIISLYTLGGNATSKLTPFGSMTCTFSPYIDISNCTLAGPFVGTVMVYVVDIE